MKIDKKLKEIDRGCMNKRYMIMCNNPEENLFNEFVYDEFGKHLFNCSSVTDAENFLNDMKGSYNHVEYFIVSVEKV